jgi:hypothetical protein
MNETVGTVHIIRTVATGTSVYELRSDGIVAQRVRSSKTQTLADARENTDAFARLVEGVARPLLVDMRITFATERGVRDHYASREATRLCHAIALLIGSTAGRVIGNLFLAIQAPTVPTRLYTDEAAAIVWLRRLMPRT